MPIPAHLTPIPLPRNVLPTDWVSLIADIGSILGAGATAVLAYQARKLKKKYQRLIRLNRQSVNLEAGLIELGELIENYTVSSAGIQGWIGSTSDHLKALAGECRGRDQETVNDVLSTINAANNRVTQDALIQIYGRVTEVCVMVERTVEDAKVNV